MAVAIVLLIVVVLSVLFNFVSPWWFGQVALNWGNIDTTVFITFWICGVVFVAVGLFVVYAVWKYKYREGARADYEPENSKLESWLTIITTVGVVAMLTPGLIVWDEYVNVPPEALETEVLAEQWKWSYRLPGADGRLGTAKIENINGTNPFGINDDDPNGQDDIIINSNEIHLQVNQPVKMLLRSKDVLHDFFVPEFRAKMDVVPGMVTYFWFEPTFGKGTYEVLCAELCGRSHYQMRGWVHVEVRKTMQSGLKHRPLMLNHWPGQSTRVLQLQVTMVVLPVIQRTGRGHRPYLEGFVWVTTHAHRWH
ncbi:MAG: alternative cytochrome c oxidase subunit 2 [Gammaproteobacteria bacterium]|nr:MAG: alternative cytochrome c oxidase subunit 2 [Gammaproteobacteria bacterium]